MCDGCARYDDFSATLHVEKMFFVAKRAKRMQAPLAYEIVVVVLFSYLLFMRRSRVLC